MQEVRKHNIRNVREIRLRLTWPKIKTDRRQSRTMQAEDMAELIIAQLKLNRRVFIKKQ
jgi:3-oxoacyl-[acyl-carrier protein] reductase